MKNHLSWIPSVYFSEGVPYVIVNSVSTIMFTQLGMDHSSMAFWTGILSLPWSLKPLWAPVLDLFGRKRQWIVFTQLGVGLSLVAAARLLVDPVWALVLALFLLVGILSATFDAAADGFYLISLDPHEQSLYSGLRSTFYRISMIAGQGGLIVLSGYFGRNMALDRAWGLAIALGGAAALALAVIHCFTLPRCESRTPEKKGKTEETEETEKKGFFPAFSSFFQKKNVGTALCFILFYRFAESQLGKISMVFMSSPRAEGGLGMTNTQIGTVNGTLGVIAMLAGGIAGGWLVSRKGLRAMLFPMAMAINLPDAVYVYLSFFQPESLTLTGSMIVLENFGYGLGFASYMLFMALFASDSGRFRTSHYAIMTGFMAIGMLLPGMAAGKLEVMLGYRWFFVYILLCTLASFAATGAAWKITDPAFGRKISPQL